MQATSQTIARPRRTPLAPQPFWLSLVCSAICAWGANMSMPANLLASLQPAAVSSHRLSGGERVAKKNALPQAFMCMASAREVRAAVILESAGKASTLTAQEEAQLPLPGPSQASRRNGASLEFVRWATSHICIFSEPHPVDAQMVRSLGGLVLHLTAETVVRARTWTLASVDGAPCGGPLGDHTFNFGVPRRIFVVGDRVLDAILSAMGNRVSLLTRGSHLLAAGVRIDGPPTVAPPPPPSQSVDSQSAGDPAPEVAICLAGSGRPAPALDALRPCLDMLAETCEEKGGFCKVIFRPAIILAFLKLDRMVNPSFGFDDIVTQVLRAVLKPEAADVIATAIADGTLVLPSRRRCRWWRIKLDIMEMRWRRQETQTHTIVRWIMIDSSPQGGWDCLLARCMELVTDGELSAGKPSKEALQRRVGLVLTTAYRQRTLPGTILGRGSTNLGKKLWNFFHMARLDGGTAFDRWRYGVRCILSDQGTERLLADCPGGSTLSVDDVHVAIKRLQSGEAGDFGDPLVAAKYLLPKALWIPGHMHLLFNALEEAITGLSAWKPLERILRSFGKFLGDKSYRQMFQHRCCSPAEQPLVAAFQSVHIDWRWEFLGDFLDRLLGIFDILRRRFNVEVMLGSESSRAPEDAHALQDVQAALAKPAFHATLECLRVLAKSLQRQASWTEGCACHGGTKTMTQNYPKRRKAMVQAVGASRCPWECKRGSFGHASWLAPPRNDRRRESHPSPLFVSFAGWA